MLEKRNEVSSSCEVAEEEERLAMEIQDTTEAAAAISGASWMLLKRQTQTQTQTTAKRQDCHWGML